MLTNRPFKARRSSTLLTVLLCAAFTPALADDIADAPEPADTSKMLLPDPTITPDGGFLTLQVENDLFAQITNTDRHYTNWLKLG